MSDAEIARLKGALQATAETAVAKDQECRRLTAEIERLLAANRDVMLHWDVLKADYEQLRSALEDVLSYVPHGDLPLNPYDKARAAIDGQPAPSPWGPIETAPKTQDESRFGPLIVLTSTHGHRAIGYWGERGGRWGWVNPNDHQIMDYWNAFTHWMPLPPAPKEVE